ncbi:dihydroneopterin aldolase [Sandaracinobacteroides saxicola]|uniref:Dihydroneopterin aldolase n=1 Tax=Sandaracinobacteroides saxicola TaxID=2759707 RepID=A0A7G5IL40_9SPHN|nr:dihydroneopterin aldolase [Sandaracinobacteroides saxicola]QMW24082.1 dihydroneopterin aldolase [Sandaracinobacteroides saxicola]
MLHAEPRRHRILLEDFAFDADIGFHDFEIGTPQRLLVTIDVELDFAHFPASDHREHAWDYDFLRQGILALVKARRYNLQETLAREIYAMIAAKPGVTRLKIVTRKPDVYPDCAAVGVILSSD